MPKKKRRKLVDKPISEKQRAADNELRALLQNADLGKFDKALKKAISPPR